MGILRPEESFIEHTCTPFQTNEDVLKLECIEEQTDENSDDSHFPIEYETQTVTLSALEVSEDEPTYSIANRQSLVTPQITIIDIDSNIHQCFNSKNSEKNSGLLSSLIYKYISNVVKYNTYKIGYKYFLMTL